MGCWGWHPGQPRAKRCPAHCARAPVLAAHTCSSGGIHTGLPQCPRLPHTASCLLSAHPSPLWLSTLLGPTPCAAAPAPGPVLFSSNPLLTPPAFWLAHSRSPPLHIHLAGQLLPRASLGGWSKGCWRAKVTERERAETVKCRTSRVPCWGDPLEAGRLGEVEFLSAPGGEVAAFLLPSTHSEPTAKL